MINKKVDLITKEAMAVQTSIKCSTTIKYKNTNDFQLKYTKEPT